MGVVVPLPLSGASMPIKSLIRTIPHHPKPGVQFRDITTLLKDPSGFRRTIDAFAERYMDKDIQLVAAIEARGFIVGAAIADRLGAGFIPIRKQGKLPAETLGEDYDLEYGTDRVEMHVDALEGGERILLVDDLIATGGTAEAAARLIGRMGGKVVEAAFIVDLPDLGGRRRLESLGLTVFALTEFEGD
jgi:adenine phosphoribosyltransferase